MKKMWKRRWDGFVGGWIFSLLLAVLIATSFKSAVADWNIVPTGSMKPTIVEGDRILVNKLAYDLKIPYTTIHVVEWDDPERGEIVIFSSPRDGRRLVKRVIGVPGDIIAMKNNHLIINGERIQYDPFGSDADPRYRWTSGAENRILKEHLAGTVHPIMISPSSPSLRSFGPVVIPKDKYFMMGDNRDHSGDSRFFGFVDRKAILGRSSMVVLSLDYKNHSLPRWQRSFMKLP